jgi:hypothetical protein
VDQTSPDKAETDLAVELKIVPAKQIAHLVSNVPNILIEQAAFTQLIDSDMRLGYEAALDKYVSDTILAASPPAGVQGDNLLERARYAIAELRSRGYSANVIAVEPDDAVALDLLKDAEDRYAFAVMARQPDAAPLWGLKIAEVPGIGDPLVIDTNGLGVLFTSDVEFLANPWTGFKKNTTDFRLEGTAALQIKSADAVQVVSIGS